ncbi:MAG: GNAT family N-acetyltransferase [Devosia sp.]
MPGYFRMRRDLSMPIAAVPFPRGLSVLAFTADVAPACRDLMNSCYGEVGYEPVAFEQWYTELNADAEYDAALMQVVADDDAVVGFCHCWTVPFVKDVVVAASFRKRGLGTAMMTTALEIFAARGAACIDIKTDVENTGAQAIYRRLGFEMVERVG